MEILEILEILDVLQVLEVLEIVEVVKILEILEIFEIQVKSLVKSLVNVLRQNSVGLFTSRRKGLFG